MTDSSAITELLVLWKEGSEHALEKLIPLVETELRRIARAQMRRERGNHTLQTTALINEAYLRLVDADGIDWQNRTHFFAVSAKIMRRVLLNYARHYNTEKRGGNAQNLNLDDAVIFTPEKARELIDLDEALERLADFDPLKSRIVELRYFGGLTVEETAEALNISPSSVSLHWRLARALLRDQLSQPN